MLCCGLRETHYAFNLRKTKESWGCWHAGKHRQLQVPLVMTVLAPLLRVWNPFHAYPGSWHIGLVCSRCGRPIGSFGFLTIHLSHIFNPIFAMWIPPQRSSCRGGRGVGFRRGHFGGVAKVFNRELQVSAGQQGESISLDRYYRCVPTHFLLVQLSLLRTQRSQILAYQNTFSRIQRTQ